MGKKHWKGLEFKDGINDKYCVAFFSRNVIYRRVYINYGRK